MTGMHPGAGGGDPSVVAAFHASLGHQLGWILVVAVGLGAVAALVRVLIVRGRAEGPGSATVAPPVAAEPIARFGLRCAFGLLWLADGLLQLQPSMPLGLPGAVFQSSGAGAPGWVRALTSLAVATWTNHPVVVATAAVWVQVGLGLALLVAPRGWWSRGAAMASVGWGIVVWAVGESMGGLFTPGGSFLFGSPGAACFYVLAGVLLALPDRAWSTPALGRRLLRGVGLVFVAAAVFQAWPGRGAWSGRAPHQGLGLTASMAAQMSAVPQPPATRSAVRWFAAFDAAHGWGVNLVVVVGLAAVGLGLVVGGNRVRAAAVAGGVAICLAVWLFVQDLGFFGGLGTDPNSMLPIAALLVVGVVAIRRARDERPVRHPARGPTYRLAQAAAALCTSAVVFGAAPMAFAALNPTADTGLTEALNGTPQPTDVPAHGFSLVDEHGHRVTMRSLRGHVVVLTFLDPVSTTDGPLLGTQLASVARSLPAGTPPVEFVAIDANPTFLAPAALRAFDAEEGLAGLSNWEFLTGSLPQLSALWLDDGVDVEPESPGATAAHRDLILVISASGRVRSILSSDPGSTAALQSSLGNLVASEVASVRSL